MKNEEVEFISGAKIRDMEEMLTEMGLENSEDVYRHLLKGEPMSFAQFMDLLGMSAAEAEEILMLYGEVNSQNEVVGFLGISLFETKHKMLVEDKTIYTWCAADTLLFLRFLGFSAKVESRDPVNGELVKLSVNEDYLEWTDPVPLYISWMEKADSCDIRNSFCSHSHFFGSEDNANKWLYENPMGKISKVEDFFSYPAGFGCC